MTHRTDTCPIPASARVLHRRGKHSSPDNRDCSHLTVSTQPGLAAITLSSFIDFVVKAPFESDVCLQGIVAKSRKPATVSFASLTVGTCLLHVLILPNKDFGARGTLLSCSLYRRHRPATYRNLLPRGGSSSLAGHSEIQHMRLRGNTTIGIACEIYEQACLVAMFPDLKLIKSFRSFGQLEGLPNLNYSGKSSDLRARMRTCFHENPSIHSLSSKAHSLK